MNKVLPACWMVTTGYSQDESEACMPAAPITAFNHQINNLDSLKLIRFSVKAKDHAYDVCGRNKYFFFMLVFEKIK